MPPLLALPAWPRNPKKCMRFGAASCLIAISSIFYGPSPQSGMRSLAVTMQVPDGAGCMVISLAAASADELDPKINFSLDDVRAGFVIDRSKLANNE